MKYLPLLFIAFLFTACGGADSVDVEQAAMDAAQAGQDKAYEGMMDAHDRVMPMMGKITAAQRAIAEEMKGDDLAADRKDLLEAANEQLEDANDGMMNWMKGLKSLDDLRANMDNDAIITYIKEEAADVAKVETAMTTAIAAANELVGGHDHDGDGHDHGEGGHDHDDHSDHDH